MTAERTWIHLGPGRGTTSVAIGRVAPSTTQVPPQDAQHSQAGYFRAELVRRLDLLDDKALSLELQLSEQFAVGQLRGIRTVERQLRLCVVERRELVEMIDALDQRFEQPAGHTQVRRRACSF